MVECSGGGRQHRRVVHLGCQIVAQNPRKRGGEYRHQRDFLVNETLSWYRCKMVADQLGIQVATLGIGEEDIAALEAELLTHLFPQERVDNFVLSPQ